VPVCIEGTYNMLEAKGYRITPANIQMHVLPAIETAELSREEIKALDERLRNLIVEKRNSIM